MSESSMVRAPSAALEFTHEQRRMIRDSYANGASAEEFAVLMEVAQSLGLSPLKRQIHFISRWDGDKGRHVWSAQVSIDGLRALAQRSGLYAGQDRPVWTEVEGRLVSCEVAVYRKDWPRAAVGVAYFDEYVQTRNDRQTGRRMASGLWGKMPHAMLAKCAEALALRKAFPEDAGGVYTDEEMMQADGAAPAIEAERVIQLDAESPKELPVSTAEPAPAPSPTSVEAVEAPAPNVDESARVEESAFTATDAVVVLDVAPALAAYRTDLEDVKLPSDGTELWRKHRRAIELLSDLERQSAWKELCEKVEKVGKLKNAKAWLKKAIHEADQREQAEHRDDDPERDPPDGGAGAASTEGGTLRARGGARRSGSSAAARAAVDDHATYTNLEAFERHIAGLTKPGHVAGAYWKRRADLREAGIDAEAYQATREELATRGVSAPASFIDAVGVRNGYVAPAAVRGAA